MNKNLLQLGRQLAAIWGQLGLNQRLTLAATTLAVLAGLVGLTLWSSRADYRLLYGKIDDAEAARVVAALNDAKVPHRIGANGSSIYVPANQVHAMRMQLASRGIPKGEGVGFEIFDKANFGISDFQQQANYRRAIEGELARTISQLDEVEMAKVSVVMPENRLLLNQRSHPTASVFVRIRGLGGLTSQSVNAIRLLVANAVEGLKPNHISVVDNQGNVSENAEPDSLAGLTGSQLAALRNLEQYLARKAEGQLEAVVGPGQAVVRVAAEINFDSQTQTIERFDPDGRVERTETVNDEQTDSTMGGSTGLPVGVAINANPNTNAITGAGSATKNVLQKKTSTKEYEVSKTTSNIVQTAGGIRRLSVAIFVAAQVEGTGANRRTVPRSAEELDKLRRIVRGALGIREEGAGSGFDEIVLEEMPFVDPIGPELTQQLDRQHNRQFWWEIVNRFTFPVLGLGVLLLFWRTLQRTPVESIPIGVPVGQGSGNGHGNGHGHTLFPGRGNGLTPGDWDAGREPGVVTVEVLNQLIKENPGNMTHAIRAWMGGDKKK